MIIDSLVGITAMKIIITRIESTFSSQSRHPSTQRTDVHTPYSLDCVLRCYADRAPNHETKPTGQKWPNAIHPRGQGRFQPARIPDYSHHWCPEILNSEKEWTRDTYQVWYKSNIFGVIFASYRLHMGLLPDT